MSRQQPRHELSEDESLTGDDAKNPRLSAIALAIEVHAIVETCDLVGSLDGANRLAVERTLHALETVLRDARDNLNDLWAMLEESQ